MTVRKKMTIELKSDLCIASGYAYAGSIDSDICYDEWGIPYIPGRRLKGCLRETAETELRALIEGDCMDRIFGQSRADGTKGIVIEDAFPRGYGEMVKALKKIRKSSDKELKEILTRQRVLEEFTTVKAQTALDEEGVADDQTLRYTRTVNQYISDVEEMVFETSVSYDLNEAEEIILGYIVSATKHIGLYRNRGLGNVKCRLDDGYDETGKTISEDIQDPETVEASGEEEWIIKYTLRNVQPLMLSNMEDDSSETRIRGQSILGLLAAKYIQCGTNSADSEEFKDLFLNGRTCYSDLVIVRNGKAYYPAPLFLRKLKKSCKYVNAAFEFHASDFSGQEKEYSPEGGNQPKKLTGKYVYISPDGKVDVAEVEKKIVYHHSHKGSNRYKEAILYTSEVIAEGKTFIGSIRLSGEYVKKMMNLLISSDLRIGKSKTAQYGKCELVAMKAENIESGSKDELRSTEQENPSHMQKEAGDLIAVIFLSDAFILYRNDESNDGARYTVFRDEVIEQVRKELAGHDICCNDLHLDSLSTEMATVENSTGLRKTAYIETTDISGYNTTLNMRKQTLQAVKAGSVIFYKLCEPTSIVEGYIGEKQHEGYGHFMIMPVKLMQYKVEEAKVNKIKEPIQSEDVKPVIHIAKRIARDMLVDDIRLQAIKIAQDNQSVLRGLTASNIGRITLMLRESLSESPHDKKNAFENFYTRVESIKKTDERKTIRRALLSQIADSKEVSNKDGAPITKWDLSSKKVREMLEGFEEDLALFDRLKELNKEDIADEWLVELWSEYVMTALVYRKYELAER